MKIENPNAKIPACGRQANIKWISDSEIFGFGLTFDL
jgi:hypothetical protein